MRSGQPPRSRPSSRCRSLEMRTLVPNTGVTQVDPALDVDVVLAARALPRLDWVLSCGYAFGGLNSALVFGRAA